MIQCNKCLERKEEKDFYLNRGYFSKKCKDCHKRYYAANREENIKSSTGWKWRNIERYLFLSCRNRAKRLGLEFNLTMEDFIIPELCPVFKTPILLEKGDGSPSVDRIDNTKGYIKGNVKIVSHRANTIKNIGTADEHRKIADYQEMNTEKIYLCIK